jgi:hypothetical protein
MKYVVSYLVFNYFLEDLVERSGYWAPKSMLLARGEEEFGNLEKARRFAEKKSSEKLPEGFMQTVGLVERHSVLDGEWLVTRTRLIEFD